MADKTGISWTDATWNPIRGCSRVSEGCRNCYAEQQAARTNRQAGGLGRVGPYEGLVRVTANGPRWTGKVRMVPEHLADPLRWKKPRRVFVNSMSDLFHESLTNEQIAAVFGVMAAAPRHTFQVLTKRAARMREWFEWLVDHDIRACALEALLQLGGPHDCPWERVICEDWRWPLPNVWLGVSTENQDAADERIPELLATPAAVRFLSCEPLIGPVTLDGWSRADQKARTSDWLRTFRRGDLTAYGEEILVDRPRISWVIAGCESGPGARRCDAAWLRSLRDQCAAAGVPFFLKQAVGTVHDNYESRGLGAVEAGAGSKRKAGGVIELPYLDGVQHAEFPAADHERLGKQRLR